MIASSASLYRRYYGSNLTKRQAHDFYQTPAIATLELVQRVSFQGQIWEPACGKGAIVKTLWKSGYSKGQVIYSDLVNYRLKGQEVLDFLTTDRCVPNIITNAPYSLAIPFILNAVTCATEKVAMLFRLDFIQSKARKQVFRQTGLTDIYAFSYRIKFMIEGKPRGMIPYAWFIWDKKHPIAKRDQYRLWII